MSWESGAWITRLQLAVAFAVALLLAAGTVWASPPEARVAFEAPIRCRFDYHQVLQPGEWPVSEKHVPVLEWVFVNLAEPKKAQFLSGGDVGSLDLVHLHGSQLSDGISLVLTQGSGAHLFTIWSDGTGYWTKHNSIFGLPAAQQFRGACENTREPER